MDRDERQLITGLFERMRDHGAPEKDRDAESLINQQLRANPDASYMLVQTVLVQEQTLEAANNRVLELEEQLRSMEEGDRPRSTRSGGFLGSYWGGRGEERRSSVPQVGARATPSAYDSRDSRDSRDEGRSPWSQSAPPAQQPAASSGGGFMRSALTTAAGVAGGMLVADSIRNMLGGGAHASTPASSSRKADAEEDARYEKESQNDPGNSEDDGNDPGYDSGGGGDGEIEI